MARTLTIGRATDDIGPLHPTMYNAWLSSGGGTSDDAGQMLQLPTWIIRDSSIENVYQSGFWATLDGINLGITDSSLFAATTLSGTVAHALANGSRIYISVDSTLPTWQRPFQSPDDNTFPASPHLYIDFWRRFALNLLSKGLDPDKVYLGVRNEVDTGPGGQAGSFRGLMADLVENYWYFVTGVKNADPRFRCGFGDYGDSANVVNSMESGRYQYIMRYALQLAGKPPPYINNGARIPLDFVAHHHWINFSWVYNNAPVKRWITEAGYDNATVEEFLSESGLSLPFVVPPPKKYIDHRGAAVLLQRNQNLQSYGIDLVTQLSIRQGTITNANGFESDYGLYAATGGNTTVIATTLKQGLNMMSKLGHRMISSTLSQDAYDATIRATCTASGSDRWVLITRASYYSAEYDNSSVYTLYFLNECRKGGIELTRIQGDQYIQAATGMTFANVVSYLADTFTPSATLPAETLAILAEAKIRTNAMVAVKNGTRDLVVDVVDHGNPGVVTIWEIRNNDTNNPVRAWDTEYAIASNFNNAKAAALAQAANTLTASFTGTTADLPRTINMETLHSVLIHLTGGPANPNAGKWVPKPIVMDYGIFSAPTLEVDTDPVRAGRLKGIPRQFLASQTNVEKVLAYGASVSWNLDSDQATILTLLGNATLSNPTNMRAGGMYSLRVVQGTSGNHTLAFGNAYKGTPASLPATTGAEKIMSFYCDGTYMKCMGWKDFT